MGEVSFFLLILFSIAAFFRADFFFQILYIFLGLYVLSRLWTHQAIRAVQCARRMPSRAFSGEKVKVELEIVNRGLLPLPWLRVNESLPIRLSTPNFYRCVLSLLPGERARLSYQLHCQRRGYYKIGPLALKAGDLMGFSEEARPGAQAEALIVYPKVVPLRHLDLPSRSPFGSLPSRERIFEDPTRPIGVRDYQPGDGLRNIHWKLSAALSRLQVKRYQPAVSLETTIFLNLNLAEYRGWVRSHRHGRVEAATELAIVVAASVANYLVEKRQAVGLSTNGRDPLSGDSRPLTLPAAKGRTYLMNLLEALARVEAAETFPFVELLRRESLNLSWGATALVITGGENPELFPALLEMSRRGQNIFLIFIDPQTSFPQIRRRAEQAGFRACALWDEKDMDIWREVLGTNPPAGF